MKNSISMDNLQQQNPEESYQAIRPAPLYYLIPSKNLIDAPAIRNSNGSSNNQPEEQPEERPAIIKSAGMRTPTHSTWWTQQQNNSAGRSNGFNPSNNINNISNNIGSSAPRVGASASGSAFQSVAVVKAEENGYKTEQQQQQQQQSELSTTSGEVRSSSFTSSFTTV